MTANRSTDAVGSEGHDVVDDSILHMDDVAVRFPVRGKGLFARTRGHVHAVNGVSLTVRSGEVLGLVGESGCGKTTLGRCIVGAESVTNGSIHYHPKGKASVDLSRLTADQRRTYQQQIRMIFQDPFSSLNPRMTVGQIVADPLISSKVASGSEAEARVAAMLRRVGLSPDHMRQYPHAFSGGQRQRVNIARALILQPRVVVADEAVSALDVSVRAQILNLLRDLQDDYDLTYLFISHDLSVVESLCDRVAVMYLGEIVEVADTEDLYSRPHHPYTEALISAVPRPDPTLRGRSDRIALSDEFPDPTNPPSGCFFHTRCHYADEHLCSTSHPSLRTTGPKRATACHRVDELSLAGIPLVADPALDGRPVKAE